MEAFQNNINNIVEKNTILYFGSLIRKKGLLELPLIFNEVIKEKPDAQLILVGKDVPDIVSGSLSTWEMMQDLFSEKAKSNVQYNGAVSHEEIRKHIEMAMVCVFPTFAEAFPVSWLEAMAMQKAIVASNVGWASEMIDDGQNGFLVPPSNHKEYAHKIIALLANPDLQMKFGIEAEKKVKENFSKELIALKSMELYQSLIK